MPTVRFSPYWPVFTLRLTLIRINSLRLTRPVAQASSISKYAPWSSCTIRAAPDQPAKPPVPVPGTMWPNQVPGSDSSPPC